MGAGGFPIKVLLSSTNSTRKKEKRQGGGESGQKKVKITSYLSVFERNLQKRVYSILTKLSGRRKIQTLTFSEL